MSNTRWDASDTRYITNNGFYVVFGSYDPFAAHETANEICSDLLQYLFGSEDYSSEAVQRLCQQSSVQSLVEDLGVPPPPKRRLERLVEAHEVLNFGQQVEHRDEKPFAKELASLYREHMTSEDGDHDFQFWPCWNSQRQRITSFVCERVERPEENLSVLGSLSPATMQCRLDVVALAAASKGVQRIVRRCEPAFVSVPVHVETLLWSKARDSYMSVLMKIDPKISCSAGSEHRRVCARLQSRAGCRVDRAAATPCSRRLPRSRRRTGDFPGRPPGR